MAMSSFPDLFRPVYEQRAAAAWLGAGVASLLTSVPFAPIAAAVCAALAFHRGRQALYLHRFRLGIGAQQLKKVSAGELMEISRRTATRDKSLYLGRGFEWTPRHAQIAAKIMQMQPDEIRPLPDWLPAPIKRAVLPRDTILDKNAIGASWIHGLEPNETDVLAALSALPGHTLIAGTTGSGKTRLYELLTFQAVHLGAVTIVLDPKGDKDWERRLRLECERAGRDFLVFHPAFPQRSIRLSPIQNWNQPSEIASRIAQLLPSEGGGDAFVAFAHMTIDKIVNGQLMIGQRPTLKSIKQCVESGVDALLEKCFSTYFLPVFGANWDQRLGPYMQRGQSRTHAAASLYRDYCQTQGGVANPTLDGLINVLQHDKEHFGKMILSLLPLLQTLCSGELGEMLSPDASNLDDQRPIFDFDSIIEGNKVLYVGLDSLSNRAVGSAIGSMLLADLAAVAGSIYNFKSEQNIWMFVDEAAEVLNDQTIQILNKGRGAGFRAFLALQTIADIEARLGKAAKAKQVLGNLNNLITLRLRDYDTAKWVGDVMGQTVIRSMQVSHSIGSESEATVLEFRGQVSRSIKEERVPLVSPDVLTRLPNLQFIAMIAGGKILKGRLPLIID